MNAALELLLPQTHFVVRGSIPQRVSNWERSNMKLNTALELLLPRTHFTARGSIPQHIYSTWKISIVNAALELLLPQTHLVVRGGIPQRVSNWQTGESSTICTGITAFPNACGDQR